MKFSKELKTTSFLSEYIELKGNLFVKGGIRIDGSFKGALESEATIYIGKSALVEAQIVTKSLVSSGKIVGNINAEDTVKINKPGHMQGIIQTCTLGIEKEVFFDGKCQLLSPPNNHKPKTTTPKLPRKAIPNRE